MPRENTFSVIFEASSQRKTSDSISIGQRAVSIVQGDQFRLKVEGDVRVHLDDVSRSV